MFVIVLNNCGLVELRNDQSLGGELFDVLVKNYSSAGVAARNYSRTKSNMHVNNNNNMYICVKRGRCIC